MSLFTGVNGSKMARRGWWVPAWCVFRMGLGLGDSVARPRGAASSGHAMGTAAKITWSNVARQASVIRDQKLRCGYAFGQPGGVRGL